MDIGLKTAWSLWDQDGRLCRFESRHFANRSKLKSGVPNILRTFPPLEVIVCEGDARLAKVWFGFLKGLETELVQAQHWRKDVLLHRQQRSGKLAKEKAIEIASRMAKEDGCSGVGRLNHDTAEAILLGYWAVTSRAWRSPEEWSP